AKESRDKMQLVARLGDERRCIREHVPRVGLTIAKYERPTFRNSTCELQWAVRRDEHVIRRQQGLGSPIACTDPQPFQLGGDPLDVRGGAAQSCEILGGSAWKRRNSQKRLTCGHSM